MSTQISDRRISRTIIGRVTCTCEIRIQGEKRPACVTRDPDRQCSRSAQATLVCVDTVRRVDALFGLTSFLYCIHRQGRVYLIQF